MKYRSDIEGLRGLSVLLVVLAHAGVPGLAGGFIGVDVFFVISGYLITGLLVEELRGTGRIDAWRFYARRVRRLLPAFVVMLVVTLAVAAAVMSPTELARHALEAAWAAGWAANLFQVTAETDYFGSARDTGLFLHTWSLGVEEQFYLLWPLLLWLTWRSAGGERALQVLLPVALIVGFGYALHISSVDPLAAYFLPQVRAWQFAAGALAFLYADAKSAPRGALSSALCGAGLLAILAASFSIRSDTVYPGWAALAPTIGAAAVLIGGAQGGGLAARALASRVPSALGRISYGWYLWHWPALAFASVLAAGDLWVRALAVAASLGVAWVVFQTIEDPIRRNRRSDPRTTALLGVLVSLLLIAGSYALHRFTRPPADGDEARVHPIMAQVSMPPIYAAGCDQWYHSAKLTPFKIDVGGDSGKTAVVIGDSAGLQWFPALASVLFEQRWNLVVLTKSACAMVDRPFYYERIRREYTECAQWRDSAVEYIRATAPSVVVVGSSGSYPFDSEAWRDGTADFLRRISAPGRRIAVLGPTPVLPFDALECLMRRSENVPQDLEIDECTVPFAQVAFTQVERALRDAVGEVPGARYLELATLVCPDGRCAAWRRGQLAFRDSQHLNARYAESLAPELGLMLLPTLTHPDAAMP